MWFNACLWLEPQGYALQISEMPQERKQQLFAEVEKRAGSDR